MRGRSALPGRPARLDSHEYTMTDDTHVDRTSVAVFGGRLATGLAAWLAPDREVRLVSDDSAVVATERDRAGLLVAQGSTATCRTSGRSPTTRSNRRWNRPPPEHRSMRRAT
ncbi:hypothetical protein BRC63_10775 [Halobacteriales archaeon QH_10_70_21]|nr:MAG: hypothetical protein BRC63_10775 [Halobacteriales archaeon QH_10_70_21]